MVNSVSRPDGMDKGLVCRVFGYGRVDFTDGQCIGNGIACYIIHVVFNMICCAIGNTRMATDVIRRVGIILSGSVFQVK